MSDRSTRKREAILDAATELFLTREYAGTSMEDIASAAAVSKQTVYKHFSDKQTLFREVALGSVEHVGSEFQAEVAAAAEATDVRVALETWRGAMSMQWSSLSCCAVVSWCCARRADFLNWRASTTTADHAARLAP